MRALEADVGRGSPPLSTRQRRNVGLVLFVSQALQVLAVGLVVTAFFFVFGAIAIPAEVRELWIGSGGDDLFTVTVAGEQFQPTVELLKVAGGLGALSALYFAIAMLTDATYREEFLGEVTGELRTMFSARSRYLKLRNELGGAAAA